MAKPNEVTESSMEEILASIRKIISEDESKAANAKPMPGSISDEDDLASDDLASNVSRLFGDDAPETATEPTIDRARDPLEKLQEVEVVRRDGPPAMSDRHVERPNSDGRIEPASTDDTPTEASEKKLPATNSAGSLLSPGADAAVASAFSQLASTILSNNSRTVEQLAEEMMRPMLKDWLDENLPPMVERLVREEIERVSRRR
jgi:uncharacterized protein